jgi:EmrB/QacA subfamily drug resistance transporter
MSVAASPTVGERNSRRRWWALVVVCLGMFMNSLDASIVNVALPAIQRDLHFSQSSLIWVVDAFAITFASFLLMAGRLGDLIGRRLVFLSGIALFTAASIVCGVAVSPAMLVVGRFVQGIGGALSASVIIAIIVTEFPEPAERAKAMSAYIFVAVGGGSIGLLVGGVLTQSLSWHWIFFINVPIGIATFLLGRALINENVGLGIRNGVDVTGSIMITVALMLGIFAIIEATQYGWVSVHTFAFGGASLLLLGGFGLLESRLANPILPLRILRIPTLVNSSVLRAFLMAGLSSALFLGALYLENVLGYSPIGTGLGFLPISLVMGLMSVGITARLVARFGPKRVLVPGMASATVGFLLLTRIGPGSSFTTVVAPAFVLIGLGAGMSFMPLLSIAMSEVPHTDAGLGSGIVNVSMQMAGALGLAILGTVATEHTKALEAAGHTTASALSGGFRLSFLVAGIFVGLGTVLAVAILKDVPLERLEHDSIREVEIENAGEPLAT